MAILFSFDDVIMSIQTAVLVNKRGQRRLVKAASTSHDASNSQVVVIEALLPLVIIPTEVALPTEFALPTSRAFAELVQISSVDGSNVKDHQLLSNKLVRKRKSIGALLAGRICVLPRPYHGLDVPRLKRFLCPSTLRSSFLMNQEHRCQMA